METLSSSHWVDARITRTMQDWRRSVGDWKQPAPRFVVRAQRLRERAYDRALRTVEHYAREASPRDSTGARQKLVGSFARFAAEALDLGHDAVGVLTGGFLPVGVDLARWARRFDPELSQAGILQATRNAWTACGLQPLLGARMELTPAILGYSLIYPYSDNFLDQKTIGREEKHRFAERFGVRLQGEMPAPANADESALWQLVSLIEQQYPRALYPAVFASLLAIHVAQSESIRQMTRCSGDDEVLRITCGKGGTSVLADAMLARGDLAEQEAEFAFAWGVLLQLGDDLQDVGEDLERGSETLFTRAVRAQQPLDALVAQLLNFSDAVAARLDALPRGDVFYKGLLRMSWRSLVLMAVAQYQEFFTAEFAGGLERHSPFRFAFLRARRERLAGERGLFERLLPIVVDEPWSARRAPGAERSEARRLHNPALAVP